LNPMEPKEIYRSLIRLHILLDAAKGSVDSGGVARKGEPDEQAGHLSRFGIP